jgi:arginyl-tRNA synthetase
LIDVVKEEIRKLIDKEKFENEKEIEKVAEQVALGAVKYSILKVGRMTNTAFDLEESISLQGDSGPYLQYTFTRTQSVLAKAKTEGNRQSVISNQLNEKGILKQVQDDGQLETSNYKLETEELVVLRWIYRFPEVVMQAAVEYVPNHICSYLHELAQRYNSFYNKHRILNPSGGEESGREKALDDEDDGKQGNTEAPAYAKASSGRRNEKEARNETREFRLLMTVAVGQVLKNGFGLLGLEAPRKM